MVWLSSAPPSVDHHLCSTRSDFRSEEVKGRGRRRDDPLPLHALRPLRHTVGVSDLFQETLPALRRGRGCRRDGHMDHSQGPGVPYNTGSCPCRALAPAGLPQRGTCPVVLLPKRNMSVAHGCFDNTYMQELHVCSSGRYLPQRQASYDMAVLPESLPYPLKELPLSRIVQ